MYKREYESITAGVSVELSEVRGRGFSASDADDQHLLRGQRAAHR